jgi:7,8-dihydroneopterin aldolase/epimerase/oxygenase
MEANNQLKDQIKVDSITCFTKIGVADSERVIGQTLRFDLELFLDLQEAGESDELMHTVSYIELVKKVEGVCESDEFCLLEHLAQKICSSIFVEFALVKSVGVRVYKPHIPSPGFKGLPSVYILRHR